MATKKILATSTLSITGLSPKSQAVIAEAARKQRRTVNAWASAALKNAAQATLTDGGTDEVLVLLKRISRKLDRLYARPSRSEETLSQMQTRLHDLGGQWNTVLDGVRERGSETFDGVREQGEEITEKTSRTISQWRNMANETFQDLQKNLNNLQKTMLDTVGLAADKDLPPATKKPISTEKSPESQATPKKRQSNKNKTAKPPATANRLKSKGKSK